jgi:hypothetical protein
LTAKQASKTLSKRNLSGLIIDETGTVKEGDKRIGVRWQYCSNVGKTANSQVGKMTSSINGDYAWMDNALLYLLQDWCSGQYDVIKQRYMTLKRKLKLHMIFYRINLSSELYLILWVQKGITVMISTSTVR